MKIILAMTLGAILAMSSERLANKSDPGVATETLRGQDSIQIEAPAPVFHYLTVPETRKGHDPS
jgi:hypothetical protein